MDSYKHDTIVVNDSYLLWENEGNNMIDKVIRIFNIINAIQANPGISATDLAFKCDVDIQGAPVADRSEIIIRFGNPRFNARIFQYEGRRNDQISTLKGNPHTHHKKSVHRPFPNT
jgi:hypothetical protein